ncbi:MAG: SBBP repeat-containing protein [Candidatus Hodarchaeota archaeon]
MIKKINCIAITMLLVFFLCLLNFSGILNTNTQEFSSFNSSEIGKAPLSDCDTKNSLLETGIEKNKNLIGAFLENQGQVPDCILYYTEIPNGIIGFAESQIIVTVEGEIFQIAFSGSNLVLPQGEDFLPSHSNHFYGGQTFHHVHRCQKIIYEELYEGITLVYKFTDQSLKYDFIVEPYANIEQIKMAYTGLDKLIVEPTKLSLTISDITLYDDKLQSWYEPNKKILPIRFCGDIEENILEKQSVQTIKTVCFTIEEPYNPSQRIIIDPIIWNFSTYLGGSGDEYSGDIAALAVAGVTIDNAGNIIVVGRTPSTDFPTLNAYQGSRSAERDAIVAKFSPEGQLLFSTYIGGSGDEWATSVAVDTNNNIVIIGTTSSTDFPVVNAYQSTHAGGGEVAVLDIFISKISADGQSLIFSTYFGGSGDDWGYAINLDANDNFAITGSTYSTNLPLVNASGSFVGGGVDAYVTKFSADGQSVIFSTYLGGFHHDWGHTVDFDHSGNLVIAGGTGATGLATSNAFQESYGGGNYDALVAKYSSNGSKVFSTYLGGNGEEYAEGVAFDANGNIVITGQTTSNNFPTFEAYQENKNGSWDAFITKLSPDGQSLIFSTFLGGNGNDLGKSICIDANGNIIATGQTSSRNFPTMIAYQDFLAGGDDVFIVQLSANGSLTFSTYMGGSRYDWGIDLAIDAMDNIVVAGYTLSNDYPTVNAYQENRGGIYDFFVSKFSVHSTQGVTTTQAVTSTTSTGTSAGTSTGTSTINNTPGFDLSIIISGLMPVIILGAIKKKKTNRYK